MTLYRKKSIKAQAGPAGSLIALIAVFIIIYLLMIPPDLRNELLNEDGSSTNNNGANPYVDQPLPINFNRTTLNVNPGRIDYLKFKEYEHPLPAVNLYSNTNAKKETIGESAYVKNGVFDRKNANISFKIADPDNIENLNLNFKLNPNRNNQGVLRIFLNDNQIFQHDSSIDKALKLPIKLSKSMIDSNNRLSFEVDSVGWKFWTTNEYEVQEINLFYDESDVSTLKSKNTFEVSESEKFNLDKVSIKYFPDCNIRNAGRLNVYINRELISSSVPDCGQLNKVEFSPSFIEAGTNRVEFISEKGQYMIDQIIVLTDLKSMTYPVYYFDLDQRLFSKTITQSQDNEICGEVDGVCPRDCDMDLDKDCCFAKSSSYWCDYQPSNIDDRCRAVTSVDVCGLCPSGYEDKDGDPPEKCEDKCGDDTDNRCPADCSKYYDEDCCYEEDPENFWCDDIPKFGLATCKSSLNIDECEACELKWTSDESTFVCPGDAGDDFDAVLRSRYDVELKLMFADDYEKKAGKIFINGYQFYFFTYSDEYTRNINNYIEDGTNSIKIEPDQTTLDIRKMVVEIKD